MKKEKFGQNFDDRKFSKEISEVQKTEQKKPLDGKVKSNFNMNEVETCEANAPQKTKLSDLTEFLKSKAFDLKEFDEQKYIKDNGFENLPEAAIARLIEFERKEFKRLNSKKKEEKKLSYNDYCDLINEFRANHLDLFTKTHGKGVRLFFDPAVTTNNGLLVIYSDNIDGSDYNYTVINDQRLACDFVPICFDNVVKCLKSLRFYRDLKEKEEKRKKDEKEKKETAKELLLTAVQQCKEADVDWRQLLADLE